MLGCSKAKFSILLPLLSALLLAACGGTPLRESLPTSADRLVAKDFAQLLVQVDSISPNKTSIRMARLIGTLNTFDTALREELEIAGYRIEPLTTELVSDVPVVGHSTERTSVDDGETVVYTVNVGSAIFRRGYTIDSEGLVQPQTVMEAKGVDTGILSQDDSIFDLDADLESDSGSDAPLVTATAPTQSTDTDLASTRSPEPIEEELIVIPPVIDASSIDKDENVLFNTRIIGESLLAFDGDSLVLGEANKRRVRNLVSNFEPRTDVFSVLGCVFQDEQNWTEDADRIAIGRSERVQSELLYAGIPEAKIRAEACAQDTKTGAPIIPVGSVLLLLNRAR